MNQSIEEQFAAIDAVLTDIEEIELPEIIERLQRLRRNCRHAFELSLKLQRRLKSKEEAGE